MAHRMIARPLLLLATALAAAGCTEEPPKTAPVTIGGKSFTLELALDDDTRRRGMMGRTSVADDGGMLFVFTEPSVQRFWMKGCLIPLDIVYVDASGRIVQMHTMQPPPPDAGDEELPGYSSRWPAQFAIELKAGTSEKLGLKEGHKVVMDLERLKRLAR